jgi:hypothetical protein
MLMHVLLLIVISDMYLAVEPSLGQSVERVIMSRKSDDLTMDLLHEKLGGTWSSSSRTRQRAFTKSSTGDYDRLSSRFYFSIHSLVASSYRLNLFKLCTGRRIRCVAVGASSSPLIAEHQSFTSSARQSVK